MPSRDALAEELWAALEAEKAPRATLTAARERHNAIRRELRAAQRIARSAEQRLRAAWRALDAAGMDATSILAAPRPAVRSRGGES
ncbi:MAG TPA: hypothetical protein VEY30_10445 [Myxococcaceae bacterium]|nr:hypothetical protein [Myxococcaceae bacterium]